MRSITRFIVTFLLLPLPMLAANVTIVDRPVVKELPLDISGSFWIDDPSGNIDIMGVDGSTANIVATRTTIAVDHDAAKEARDLTKISFEGDQHTRLVRTLVPPLHSPRWSSKVDYVIRVPRTVHVRIGSRSAEHIRVANIMGNVTVKGFNGTIILDGVSGASVVETTNGLVVYNYTSKPVSNAQINAINANIEVHLPADSNFDWTGDTLRGAFLTTFPARVQFGAPATRSFRASINAPNGPTLATVSLMGRVAVLANGTNIADARSIYAQAIRPASQGNIAAAPLSPRMQIPIVTGDFAYDLDIVDVNIGEIKGNAHVTTRAGAVELDRVWGECAVFTRGGPLTLGEIMRSVQAYTGGGDVLVRAAREGGTVATEGGLIQVLYSGGPITMHSGGGDIVLRQAGGPVFAETRSGDINITLAPTQKTDKIEAKTSRGNVKLTLAPGFAADVDATVITSDPDADVIHSDFSGLTIRKEQVGAKTKVHAVGRINGGGERMELYASDGTIQLVSQSGPMIVAQP